MKSELDCSWITWPKSLIFSLEVFYVDEDLLLLYSHVCTWEMLVGSVGFNHNFIYSDVHLDSCKSILDYNTDSKFLSASLQSSNVYQESH